MPLHNHHNQDLLEEILAAAKPGTDPSVREDLLQKLRSVDSSDDTIRGLQIFLEDHGYDFDELHQFLSEERKSFRVTLPCFQSYRLAAAVIAFLFFGSAAAFLIFQQRSTRIDQYLIYEPGLPVFASASQSKQFHNMMSAYRLQDWENGRLLYESQAANRSPNDTLQYFGGWFYVETKAYTKAIACFESVIHHTGSVYREKAELLLAISTYRNNKPDAARHMLEAIAQKRDHRYARTAAEMLSDPKLW